MSRYAVGRDAGGRSVDLDGAVVKVGVIGCGKISDVYLRNAAAFDALEVISCADLLPERAEAQAKAYKIPKACSPEELLADPEVEVVLNLTVPTAHAGVTLAALDAGKNVYSEKPLATDREDGGRILESASGKGLLVGCAPDTFLGGGLQTCRKLLDDGVIGEPVAATAVMMSHGPEDWHPNPDFFYQPGAGPMFDMGPYYLTALATLLGPVRRVASSTRATFAERMVTSEPHAGTTIKVNTPTHVAGVLDFEGGAVGTLVTSFDVWAAESSRVEVYGTEGSLSVPDPNTFGGPVRLCRAGSSDWEEVPLTHPYTGNCRGLGLADMADALLSGRPHRASGRLAYHALEVIQALLDSSEESAHVMVDSTFERPEPLPAGEVGSFGGEAAWDIGEAG